jgi:nucleoside-diphosphate-sugar epimerase
MSGPVLIFGARGQVGRELMALAGARRVAAVGLSRADANVTDDYAVRAAIDMHKPAAVVNAAGYTAVDRAEREVEAATAANVTGPAILAAASSENDTPIARAVLTRSEPGGTVFVFPTTSASGTATISGGWFATIMPWMPLISSSTAFPP